MRTQRKRRSIWIVLCLSVALGLLAAGAGAASAGNCISEKAGRKLTCTANDIQIAKAINVRDLQGHALDHCFENTTIDFIADFQVVTTATSRYDIGLWFATDGDPDHNGALSGTCSVNMIQFPFVDQATGQTLGAATAVDLDGDACKDVNTANGWGPPNGQVVTVKVTNVPCKAGPTGKLSLPNCTSWSQNSGLACASANDTTPGSPSKCHCDTGFEVPISVDKGTGGATKDVSPASLPEPGGEFTYSISFTNSSQVVSVTLDQICDDRYGTIAGANCPAGLEGSINSTNCSVPQTLAPGQKYSCAFTANFNRTNLATSSVSLTDTVTFSGHDSNATPNQVVVTASATATISDVPPDGTITKSLDGLRCAVVRYNVKATNNKANTGVLTLTKLVDSSFGDITTPATACDITTLGSGTCVTATTCNLGTGVAVGATPYQCTFDAYFCGTPHTNTVTATWSDGHSTTTPSSNTLTIGVSATDLSP